MKLNSNVLKIELGCDDWDEPLIIGDDAIAGLTNPTAHEPTTAPPPELLSINHHEVLAQTLIQFESLKDSAVDQAVKDQLPVTELSLYFTSNEQIQQINLDYRGKDKPTNVLSFESELPPEIRAELAYRPLGELVFSLEVIREEAAYQGKTLIDHYTHLLVHGCLHLLGLDHETSEADQAQMEALEIKILAQLGIADPYQA